MNIKSQIYTEIDYAKTGKQLGHLEVPTSTNSAGWANQYLPVCVVKNGEGPTALIFGGNHGDEYEGPVTLVNLARWLDPAQVEGRVILVPMLNRPAVAAGTRLSAVDGRNMNRSYYSQYAEVQVIDHAFSQPMPVLARSSGMLFVRRAFPLTQQGECVAVTVRPYSLA